MLKIVGAGGIRQTATARLDLRIFGGYAIIMGDGGVDGFGKE